MKFKGKHGEIEGEHNEIRDFCKSVDFDPSQFFLTESAPSCWWLVSPIVIYFIMAIALVFYPQSSSQLITLATLFSFILMAIVVVVTHLKWSNVWVSGFVAFIFLISVPIVMGWVTPQEMVNKATDSIEANQQNQ